MPDLITQADVEHRMGGVTQLVQLADDDGDGTADAAIVSAVLDEASRLAEGLLFSAFPDVAQIGRLAADDSSIRGAICDVAIGLLHDRRPQFVSEGGREAMHWRRVQGEKVLRELGQAKRRSPAEPVQGKNGLVTSRVSREKPPTTFIFADTAGQRASGGRGPGGF